jgi:hypothetical protein
MDIANRNVGNAEWKCHQRLYSEHIAFMQAQLKKNSTIFLK